MSCCFYLDNEKKVIVTKFPNDVHLLEYLIILEGIDTIVNFSENIHSFIPSKKVIHLPFKDGGVPDKSIVRNWLNILSKSDTRNILIHCDSSVGRAPLMLAIAMMHTSTTTGVDVVQELRQKIPSALNTKQLNFVLNYKTNKISVNILKFLEWFR